MWTRIRRAAFVGPRWFAACAAVAVAVAAGVLGADQARAQATGAEADAIADPTTERTAADAPLSVIDWLSRGASPRDLVVMTEDPAAGPITTEEITVTPLGAARIDGLGVLPASVTGLPGELWGPSGADTIAALIAAQPAQTLSAVQDLMLTLLLAELDPPAGGARDGVVMNARVTQLLRMGAVDQAAALLDEIRVKPLDLARLAFDAALLSGREERACETSLSPALAAQSPEIQVYCQARTGDPNAAQVTLETTVALGAVDDDIAALLFRFLLPELARDDTPLPKPLSPLAFRLSEAIGTPVPTARLPLAFARSDLRALNGWKAQLEAAERLARARSIPAAQLFAIYADGRPAASGGIWDRVRKIQTLDQALRRRDAGRVAQALAPARRAMARVGLEVTLAHYIAPLLDGIPLPGAAGAEAFELLLLSSDPEPAARTRVPVTPREAFAADIATGSVTGSAPPRGAGLSQTAMLAAIHAAFAQPVGAPARFAPALAKGALGTSILSAAQLLAAGHEADPGEVTTALRLFRAVGLERVARATALELLLTARPQ